MNEVTEELNEQDKATECAVTKHACRSGKREREESPTTLESSLTRRVKTEVIDQEGSKEKLSNDSLNSKMISNDQNVDFGTQESRDSALDVGDDSISLNDPLTKHSADVPEEQSDKSNVKVCEGKTELVKHEECESVYDSLDLIGEFEDFFDSDFDHIEKRIDLSDFHKCKIIKIESDRKFKRIIVRDTADEGMAIVDCYGFWMQSNFELNDTVSIKAKPNGNDWIVDNNDGFIVTQPHILISGTSIMSANFCRRRGVLTENFRGLDCLPNLEVEDFGRTIGILVHQVLQKVLVKKINTIVGIREIIEQITSTRQATQMLYDINLSLTKCRSQMEFYIPKIYNFVQRYIYGQTVPMKDTNFAGKIESIKEIEENIWLPELGIKGKIDVTVDVVVNQKRRTMPLEVKTGNPSFSMEHRGQLILYCMMMSLIGEKVDSGLLLYIRENLMQEIKYNRPEARDLVMLRNTYADYITKLPKFEEIKKDDNTVEKVWLLADLPEPINHTFTCSRCEYKTLCALSAEKDQSFELPENHCLRGIAAAAMEYLTPEHIEYIFNWIIMVQLEDSLKKECSQLKDIWTVEPFKREKQGTCICDLEVCGDVVEEGKRFLHTFVRKYQEKEYPVPNLTQVPFLETDYMIVSTNTRLNVSAGYVKKKNNYSIELLLDRNVVRQNPSATFHIDFYPFSGLSQWTLPSIACLLSNNEITNKLRRIIIDREPTTFSEKLPQSLAKFAAPILFKLNSYQRKAILSVISSNDYLLIKGMPGTGKTRTLVALIELLVNMGQSILVTSHTHSAVDNILVKLLEKKIDFLRLGTITRVNSELLHKCEDAVTADCKTPEKLEAVYNSKQVVAVTCMGSTHSLIARRIFDVCLVDESTQVLQPILLRPMFSAKKFVLIGDPKQLPPIVQNDEAKKLGMNESLFARLDNEINTVTLEIQYRMNRKIMSVANDLTYEGFLKAASSKVAKATLELKDETVLESCELWISKALSVDIEASVIMLHTDQTYALKIPCEIKLNEENGKISNIYEVAIISRLISVLLEGGIETSSIGIICPFRAQVKLVRSICKDVEVNTVDQYQGRDKEVIIYSCTRSLPETHNESTEFGILEDQQRLTVAVTRAKHKLIIVGDKLTLKRYKPFDKLFDIINDDIIHLKPGTNDFTWESVVQLLK